MDAASIKRAIIDNGTEITRLHARIDETLRHRGEGKRQHDEWSTACEEFHARYDQLAFPGGYDRARERLDAGDSEVIETALCFLEVRPYFFRSGYMFKDLLRRVKRAPLTAEQQQRLAVVLERRDEWRKEKSHDA